MSKEEDLKKLLASLPQEWFDRLPQTPQPPTQSAEASPNLNKEWFEYALVGNLWKTLREKLESMNHLSQIPYDIEFNHSFVETSLRTEDLEEHEEGPKGYLAYLREYTFDKNLTPPKAIEFRLGKINGDKPRDKIAQRCNLAKAESLTFEGIINTDKSMQLDIIELFDTNPPSRLDISLTIYNDESNKKLLGIISVPRGIKTPHESIVPEDFAFHHLQITDLPPRIYYMVASGLRLFLDRLQPQEPSLQ